MITFHLTSCHDFVHEMQSNSVDLILTDPPYGIDYQSGRRKVKRAKIHDDNNLDWLPEWSKQMYRVLKPNKHLYCFTRADVHAIFRHYLEEAGFTFIQKLVWVKNNHGSGDLNGAYAPMHEEILFMCKGQKPKLNGKRIPDVLEFDSVPENERHHPTQKPVDLLRVFIEKSTSAPPSSVHGGRVGDGGLVFDPFAGVASTAVACIEACNGTKSAPRNFIGCEINYGYHIIGQQRIQSAQSQIKLL